MKRIAIPIALKGFRTLMSAALLLPLICCVGTDLRLPSVSESKTALSLPGKVVWHDLITHTPKESRLFYETLFGWEFEELGWDISRLRQINYTLIRHNGTLIGGMVDANQLGRPNPEQLSQWVVVISVGDIDAATAQVAAQKGTVRQEPVDVGERGKLALVEDASGAEFALLQTRDGDPQDTPLTVGSFLWDEVWTDDVDSASRFYERITGLETADHAGDQGGSYRLLKDKQTARMGVLPMPLEGLAPTWVSYIRVADADPVARQAAALGGRVLIDVRQREVGGEAALIAGPSGAGIAIQTWTPRPGAEETTTTQ